MADAHETQIEKEIKPWIGKVVFALLTAGIMKLSYMLKIATGPADLEWIGAASAGLSAIIAGFVASRADWIYHKLTGAKPDA